MTKFSVAVLALCSCSVILASTAAPHVRPPYTRTGQFTDGEGHPVSTFYNHTTHFATRVREIDSNHEVILSEPGIPLLGIRATHRPGESEDCPLCNPHLVE